MEDDGRRPSLLGQVRSETQKFGLGLVWCSFAKHDGDAENAEVENSARSKLQGVENAGGGNFPQRGLE